MRPFIFLNNKGGENMRDKVIAVVGGLAGVIVMYLLVVAAIILGG